LPWPPLRRPWQKLYEVEVYDRCIDIVKKLPEKVFKYTYKSNDILYLMGTNPNINNNRINNNIYKITSKYTKSDNNKLVSIENDFIHSIYITINSEKEYFSEIKKTIINNIVYYLHIGNKYFYLLLIYYLYILEEPKYPKNINDYYWLIVKYRIKINEKYLCYLFDILMDLCDIYYI